MAPYYAAAKQAKRRRQLGDFSSVELRMTIRQRSPSHSEGRVGRVLRDYSPPASRQPSSAVPVPCFYFKRGDCHYGERCFNLHQSKILWRRKKNFDIGTRAPGYFTPTFLSLNRVSFFWGDINLYTLAAQYCGSGSRQK